MTPCHSAGPVQCGPLRPSIASDLNEAAIMHQVQDRVNASISSMLPSLYGILSMINNVPQVLNSTPDIRELYDLLNPLREIMARKIVIPTLGTATESKSS